ncbi:MAG TPA: hypothetical protein PKE55_15025, partial [Kiritimatiellia bacterium]|nr:hypothetical protein [Kiritimatiellia bacterium]
MPILGTPTDGSFTIKLYDSTTNGMNGNEAIFRGFNTVTYTVTDPFLPPPDDETSEDEVCPDRNCDDADDVEECPYHPVGCSTCSSHGSPRPAFHSATFNLQINDTPIWHDSAVGPKLEVAMRFSNFAATNARTSFGAKWGSNWDSYLVVENAQTNRVRLPSGSVVGFTAQGASTWAPPASLSGTMVLTNGVYQYRKVNGDVLQYAESAGNPNLYLLSRMWDAWSNTVAVTYTADRIHRVTQVVPDSGNYLEFSYNGADTKATSVTTHAEAYRIATFHYSPSGFLTNVVDMSDFGYVYTYTNGFISGVYKGSLSGLRRLGVHYSITPDVWTATNSHRITMTDSEDRVMTYTWAFGLVLKDIAFQGVTNREIYQVAANPHRKAVVTTHANTRTIPIQFTYNANARLMERVDRTGATWSYSRNGAHRITSVTDPHDNVWSNVYAANGIDLLYQIPPTGPIQRVFTYVPDRHVPATESNALGRVTTYSYNPLGLLTNRHDGRTTNTYLHDTTGRLVSHHRNGELVQTNRYDPFGRRVWTMDAAGLVVTSAYDNLNRLISETYITPDGQTTRELEYDCCAISRITDRKGRDT